MTDPRTMTNAELCEAVHSGQHRLRNHHEDPECPICELARRLEEAEAKMRDQDIRYQEWIAELEGPTPRELIRQRDAAIARAERAESHAGDMLAGLPFCDQHDTSDVDLCGRPATKHQLGNLCWSTCDAHASADEQWDEWPWADAVRALAATATTEKEDGHG